MYRQNVQKQELRLYSQHPPWNSCSDLSLVKDCERDGDSRAERGATVAPGAVVEVDNCVGAVCLGMLVASLCIV
jgi:hypothetical protein